MASVKTSVDVDDDTHFCLRCQTTITGIDNYVIHRKTQCNALLAAQDIPVQIEDESLAETSAIETFGGEGDASLQTFFSSLELCKPDDLNCTVNLTSLQLRKVHNESTQFIKTEQGTIDTCSTQSDENTAREIRSTEQKSNGTIRKRGRPRKMKPPNEDEAKCFTFQQSALNVNVRRTSRHAPKRLDNAYVYGNSWNRPRNSGIANKDTEETEDESVSKTKDEIINRTSKEDLDDYTYESFVNGSLRGHRKFAIGVPVVMMSSDQVLHSNTKSIHKKSGSPKKEKDENELPKKMRKRKMSTVHPKTKVCPVCTKEVRLTSIAVHMRTHTGEKPHKCRINSCTAEFAQLGTLNVHMRNHFNQKDFVCGICGARFTRTHALKRHMYSHEKGKPKPYLCDTCGHGFFDKYVLRHHMKIHGFYGGKHVCCTVDGCDQKYRNQSELRQHMRVHTGMFTVKQCNHVCTNYTYLVSFLLLFIHAL